MIGDSKDESDKHKADDEDEPREAETNTLGASGVVAIWVTQPLWPWRAPTYLSDSVDMSVRACAGGLGRQQAQHSTCSCSPHKVQGGEKDPRARASQSAWRAM